MDVIHGWLEETNSQNDLSDREAAVLRLIQREYFKLMELMVELEEREALLALKENASPSDLRVDAQEFQPPPPAHLGRTVSVALNDGCNDG
jgi:hypothetical protein